jgi:hypothetical protein
LAVDLVEGVQERLKFLHLIVKQSSLVLDSEHVVALYNTMPLSCVDMFWDWVSVLGVTSTCIDMKSTRIIFETLLCNALVTSTTSQKCWSCWERLFLHVNAAHVVRMEQTSTEGGNGGQGGGKTNLPISKDHIYFVKSVELVGIDVLWAIATSAVLPVVTYASKGLFKTLIKHLNPTRKISLLMEQRKNEVMAQVTTLLGQSGGTAAEAGTAA